MRMHRVVRAVASTEPSIVPIRSWVSRSRFSCLNAPARSVVVTRGTNTHRYFSHSARAADAAEAVLKQAAADPSNLTQEKIIQNLDKVEKGRLSRIRNIGIAVCPVCRRSGRRLTHVGAYRQWENHCYRASTLLHRPNQFNP